MGIQFSAPSAHQIVAAASSRQARALQAAASGVPAGSHRKNGKPSADFLGGFQRLSVALVFMIDFLGFQRLSVFSSCVFSC